MNSIASHTLSAALVTFVTLGSVQAGQIDDAKRLLSGFESGDPSVLEVVSDDQYIQHNVNFPSGKSAIAGFFAGDATGITVETVRAFEDGEHVVLHSVYGGVWNGGQPQVAFDIFRFEGGRIVEHWDNLQDTAPPNPSGRTQIDGDAEVRDSERTAENKALVESFVREVLVAGDFSLVPRYYSADLAQHNSAVADGLTGLQDAVTYFAENGIAMEYHTVHKVLGQGNFVLVVSEGAFAGQPTAYYDLFRVDNGVIVEHWDVLETLDERAHRDGDAGKF